MEKKVLELKLQKIKNDLERQYKRENEVTNSRWESKYNVLAQTSRIQIDNDRTTLQLTLSQLKQSYHIMQQTLDSEKKEISRT